MDIFILFGAGLLGAAFLASQNPKPVALLWRTLLGGSGGLLAWFVFEQLGSLPTEPTLNGFIMMFVLGGATGGLSLQFFLFLRRKIKGSQL